jgi:hypothetical protein
MSSIDLRQRPTAAAAAAPPRLNGRAQGKRRHRLLRFLGGSVLTGLALALSAALVPVAAVYTFVWLAQHY